MPDPFKDETREYYDTPGIHAGCLAEAICFGGLMLLAVIFVVLALFGVGVES